MTHVKTYPYLTCVVSEFNNYQDMANDAYEAEHNYILPHDESELHRLNVQHKYLTRVICDQRLIYDKNVNLDKGSCVLDSGTGTGAWAVDLANEVPELVEIYAADISSANFPPSPPSNVHFSIASVTFLPSEWTGQFDFVNQRFLFGALLAKEWPKALSEIHRALKSGGAVQLIEMDPRSAVPETPAVLQHLEIVRKMFDARGLHVGISGSFSEMLLAAGFVDVVSEKKQLPMGRLWGEIGMQGAMALGGANKNVAGVVVKLKVLASEGEYQDLIDNVEQEWNLHGTQYPCRIVCARKPSTC